MEFRILGIGSTTKQWLSQYLSSFRILDVDERTTVHYRAVRTELKKAGTPIPSHMFGFELHAGSIRSHFLAATVISALWGESQGWNGDQSRRPTSSVVSSNAAWANW